MKNCFKNLAGASTMLAGAFLLPSIASAATIVPTMVTGSSSFPGYEDIYVVDGNPLTDWASNQQGTATSLAIDLGSVFNLVTGTFTDRVTSGGGNGSFVGGLFDFTTSFNFQQCDSAACTTLLGPVATFSKAAPTNPTSPSDFAYTADLSGFSGRYFLYSVNAANGVNPGLSDLSFNVAAVPEPSTWLMMLFGFGMIGYGMRSAKRRSDEKFETKIKNITYGIA